MRTLVFTKDTLLLHSNKVSLIFTASTKNSDTYVHVDIR